MRAFDETINWISYRLELRQAPPSFWLLLGDCAATIRAIRLVPMPVSEASDLEREILAKGVFGRSAMDGSPVQLDQIIEHLRGDLRLPPSKEHIQLELDRCIHTWQYLTAQGTNLAPLDTVSIQKDHRSITGSDRTGGWADRWRKGPVQDANGKGIPDEMIPLFMEDLCDWLNGPELRPVGTQEEVPYALVRALLAELYLHWIRPFATAHARLSSTVVQRILIAAGAGSIPGHLLSAFFHKHHQAYLIQAEQASSGVPDPIPFLAFALRGLNEELMALRSRIRTIQAQGQWTAHLCELFEGSEAGPARRQQQLLLDLAKMDGPVNTASIPAASPTLARMYAGVTKKTLRRDIEQLERLGMLFRGPEGFRVRLERLLFFRY